MGRKLGDDTLTVQRAGTSVDPYSQLPVADDWSNPATHDIPGCDAQPGASAEYLIGRDFSEVAFTVYAPSGSDITEYDRALFRGVVYDVDGRPAVWSGRLGYVEIHLKVRKG